MAVAGNVSLELRAEAQDRASKVLRQVGTQLSKLQKELIASGAVSTKLGAQVAVATANMGRFGERLTSVADGSARLAERLGGLRAGLLAAAAAVAGAKIVELGKAGAEAADRMVILERQVAGFRGIVEETKASTAGMIQESDIVRQAALFKSFGLDMAQFGDAMELASKAAIVMGRSTEQMTESLVVGLARESPQILDNLGVMVRLSEARERAAEMTGKHADALTDAERKAGMMAVTLDKLRVSTAGVEFDDAQATSFAQASAAMSETWEELGKALAPVGEMLAPLAQMLRSLADLLGAVLSPVLSIFSGLLGGVLDLLAALVGAVVKLLKMALFPFTAAIEAIARAVGADGLARDMERLNRELVGVTDTTDDTTDAMERQEAAAKGLADALETLANREATRAELAETANEALRRVVEIETRALEARSAAGEALSEEESAQVAVNKAFLAASKAADDFAKTERALAEAIVEATSKMDASRGATVAGMMDLREQYRSGGLAAGEFLRRTRDLAEGNTLLAVTIGSLTTAYERLMGVRELAGAAPDTKPPRGGRSGGPTAAQRIEFAARELEILRATDEVTRARLKSELDMAQLEAGFRGSGKSKAEQEALRALTRVQGQQDYLAAVRETAEEEAAIVRLHQESGAAEKKRREDQGRRVALIEREIELLQVADGSQRRILQVEHQRQDALAELAEAREDGAIGMEREAEARLRLIELQRRQMAQSMQEAESEREQRDALRQTVEAFRQAGASVGAYDERLGGLIGSLGSVTQIWGEFAAAQERSSAAMVGAAKDSIGAMGHSLAAFVEDTRARAALQGAIEAARAMMALAAAIESGDAKMYAAFATHTLASGMFFAVAGGAGGRRGSAGGAGGSGAGSTGGGSYGSTGGGGGGGGGQTTIVVQFGDGIVLGSPQDVGRAVQEAQQSMRGTGSKAAA